MFRFHVLLAFSVCILQPLCAWASLVNYNFEITWVWASPDGVGRPVIGINGEWPLPTIEARVGDQIQVEVHNSLGNQSASLHFHGLFMNGTTNMDGTSMVSQCAIGPGSTFVYRFEAQQSGTYWYHSHEKSQYPDGLRGMLIIRDAQDPYTAEYDEEIAISLSDWYHGQMPALLSSFDKVENKMRDPAPDANLINDMVGSKIHVEPGQTYLVRLANIGAFVGQYFWVQNHAMTVIEVDGVYTHPQDARMIYIAAGQRYSFLLKTKAKDDATRNFPIVSRMDAGSFSSHVPWPKSLDAEAWLTYAAESEFPDPDALEDKESKYALDDMVLTPLDKQPLLEPVDRSIAIDIDMKTQEDGIIHWMFNTVRYTLPKLPSLFATLAKGPDAANPNNFEPSSQTFVFERGEIVEITVHNKHMWKHPLHLHGHNFQVINRTKGMIEVPPEGQAPMRRDTVMVNSHGWLTFRFRADNPGVWLMHCHMEWHAHSGLMATFVEAPLQLQEQLRLSNVSATLDPSQACDPGRVTVVSTMGDLAAGVTDGKQEDNKLAGLDLTMILAITIAAAGSIGAVCFYLWQKRRSTQQGAYARVPLADIDEGNKRVQMDPS